MSAPGLSGQRLDTRPVETDAELAQPRLGPLRWPRWAWRQLTSMRTALFLLLLLAVAAVPGSIFPQRGIAAGRVGSYLAAHRTLGPWLDRLDLFNVYASPWFAAIYLLLVLSLVGVESVDDPQRDRGGVRSSFGYRDLARTKWIGLEPDVGSGPTVLGVPNDVICWWSVGELARAARVTVRTLHYYDRLGLVTPSGRTSGGHRRYDQDDLTRLLRVLSLRDLGFVLEELPALLNQDQDQGPSAALLTTARAHRARVAEQLQHQAQLRDRLDTLVTGLERGDPPSSDVLLTTLEAMAMTVHLTRIYTRRGDDGRTDLAGTTRVAKTAPQVEAIGAVDELNAALGVSATTDGLPARFVPWLQRIQNDLFDIGAQLARPEPEPDSTTSPPAAGQGGHRIDQGYTAWLEQLCDQVNADLPALRSFILPGGTAAAAHLHLARTICRRAERRALAVARPETEITCYLNRLSDLLFIISRAANTPVDELLWNPGRRAAV